MNNVKKIYVNFQKTRSVYDPAKIKYKMKYKPSTTKEEIRQERRYKKINRYDDEFTNEPPIEALTNSKASTIYKMLNEFANSHRLTRKPMPAEEKAEYIKKCKEFSLYQNNEWRKKRLETLKLFQNEEQMYLSSAVLPVLLLQEVMDVEDEYLVKGEDKEYFDNDSVLYKTMKIGKEGDLNRWEVKEAKTFQKGQGNMTNRYLEFKENSEDIEAVEHSDEFLYLPQLMRVYPDDYHIILKTIINVGAYKDSRQGGIEGAEAGGLNDNES